MTMVFGTSQLTKKPPPQWAIETYSSPYGDAVVSTMQRVSRHHDNGLGGDWDAAYDLMKKRHEKFLKFGYDKRLFSWHNGALVWSDPDDIYKIDDFTCDDDGWCEPRDCGKVWLHFELLKV